MKPEEVFKIDDGENIKEFEHENVEPSKDSSNEKEKIDIFRKDLSIDDLIEFLKQNNKSVDFNSLEKYYNTIITNNNEKEFIVKEIKELDREKNVLIKQVEVEPNNFQILKKINDIDEKISNLNTEERIKEDNVKEIIKIINRPIETGPQEPKDYKSPEIAPQEHKDYKSPETTLQEPKDYKSPETTLQEPKDYKSPEIAPQEPKDYKPPENFENKNKKDENLYDSLKEKNPAERIKLIESQKEESVLKNTERDETLDEIKKNNEMLKNISKDMMSNFDIMLKTILQTIQTKDEVKNGEKEDVAIEPSYQENPKISQPNYISQYRESLRKYSGISPFIGYDTNLKGDNLGSYI